jgi:hypothetical protein
MPPRRKADQSQSPLERSRCFGTADFAGAGRRPSPKHAAVPISDDQKATQSKTGMTFFLLWFGH